MIESQDAATVAEHDGVDVVKVAHGKEAELAIEQLRGCETGDVQNEVEVAEGGGSVKVGDDVGGGGRKGVSNVGADEFRSDTVACKKRGSEGVLFAEQAEQQVLGADVMVVETLPLFGGIGEDVLALVGERDVNCSGERSPWRTMERDLFAQGFGGGLGVEEARGQSGVFAKQAEEEVFGLDLR